MGKYLKLFDTHSEYNSYITGQDKILPNVSYCENENECHYNPWYDPERFVAKFNVTSTTSPTSLITNPTLLSKIEIDGVEYTGNDIFSHYNHTFSTTGIHIVKYTLTDGTTSIYGGSFSNNPNMISITIPDSITTIGGGTFSSCSGLTSITIPNSVTTIGQSAFDTCSALTSIVIPNSVTTIGDEAFRNCSSLTSVIIPDSVTSIGGGAFSGCSGLTSITIPNSVTSIGCSLCNFAFENVIFESINPNATFVRDTTNKILTNIAGDTLICGFKNTVAIPNTVTTIGNYAFSWCSGITSITIPNSVTTIGNSDFSGCTGLTSIIITNSVTTIGNSAFSGCTGLTSIIIPNSVTTIGNSAFSGCTGLTSITIPNTVTSISQGAFASCIGLTSVTIGNSVTSIGERVFYGCSSLISVTSLATTAPTIQSRTFLNVNTGGTLIVPAGSTGYNVWMGTGDYYLGKYNWTKVEQ